MPRPVFPTPSYTMRVHVQATRCAPETPTTSRSSLHNAPTSPRNTSYIFEKPPAVPSYTSRCGASPEFQVNLNCAHVSETLEPEQ